jgi:hypothetical protein
MHAVFPNPAADPELAESYDFARTDAYIAAVRHTGARIIYRLGESIEHDEPRRFVHPPADPDKWARVCLGIIRHYNEGWAGGFHHGIEYWEIWNEPENRPAMWSGTDEDYFRLYRTAARAIRERYPQLKIGGPAVGSNGQLEGQLYRPTEFVREFIRLCRDEKLPLDFFSWHCYTDDPRELVARAQGIRKLLDEYGFSGTESHLNEWNFLPGNTWKALGESRPEERQRFYDEMAGAPGAAFLASALIQLQTAPIDVGNLFHGEVGGFGLFNEHGVAQRNYHAVEAFHRMLSSPHRVHLHGATERVDALAGWDDSRKVARVLVSSREDGAQLRIKLTHLPWQTTSIECRTVDSAHALALTHSRQLHGSNAEVQLITEGPSVTLLELREAKE